MSIHACLLSNFYLQPIHRTREKFFNGSFVARLRGCSGLPTTSIYILYHHVWHLVFLQHRPLMPLYISIYISDCYSQHLTTTNLIFFFIKKRKFQIIYSKNLQYDSIPYYITAKKADKRIFVTKLTANKLCRLQIKH